MDSLPGMPRTRNASVEEYEARLSAKKDVESSLKQWAERVLAGRCVAGAKVACASA